MKYTDKIFWSNTILSDKANLGFSETKIKHCSGPAPVSVHTGDAEQGCSEVIYRDSEIQHDQHDDVHEEVGMLFKVTFIYNDVLIRFRPCPLIQ